MLLLSSDRKKAHNFGNKEPVHYGAPDSLTWLRQVRELQYP
jgi:hypothetical protein